MTDSRAGRPQQPSSGAADGLVLSGARLADGRLVDVRLGGGRILAVGTAGSLVPEGRHARGSVVDLTGHLLLPAPVEPHAHGETAFTAELAGPVPYSVADVQRRTTEAALLQLGHGATAVRTQVRIGDVQGLAALEGALQARQSLRGLVELTVVALPRLLTGVAGADGLAVLRDAVKMGAGVVGGCPDLDPDPSGHTEAVLRVASEQGLPVDLHTDAADPALLARLASAAAGLAPGAVIGPGAGLARLPQPVAARTAERLAVAGVGVVCLPQGDCGVVAPTGTRSARAFGPRTAPVRLLRAAGVRVAAGGGALRDVANPVGRGDPLEAAYLLASQAQVSPEQAYDVVGGEARAVLGLAEVRIEAGFPAELLAVRGERVAAALSLAYSRIVVHRGRVVARTSAVREYCDFAGAAERELPRQSPRGGAAGGE
ncbi:Pterin deaminase [Streptomyces sp. RB5]|uniref:Pterin deaminase n=1 Tax=Streptomyces smaragdinus TaxID=2585196 RepID=A0A7K0CIX2_9ACTN|nr:amidohydrolase family protein [Streptomyces smaragdinus]MQY13361.1 Pterin deaminase [Streptomyces smaragdinus]